MEVDGHAGRRPRLGDRPAAADDELRASAVSGRDRASATDRPTIVGAGETARLRAGRRALIAHVGGGRTPIVSNLDSDRLPVVIRRAANVLALGASLLPAVPSKLAGLMAIVAAPVARVPAIVAVLVLCIAAKVAALLARDVPLLPRFVEHFVEPAPPFAFEPRTVPVHAPPVPILEPVQDLLDLHHPFGVGSLLGEHSQTHEPGAAAPELLLGLHRSLEVGVLPGVRGLDLRGGRSVRVGDRGGAAGHEDRRREKRE